jgi:hypothetical protein
MGVSTAVIVAPAYRQLNINPNFSADTNWTKGAGWTISGGAGIGTVATENISQTVDPLISGVVYRTRIAVNATIGKVVVVLGSQAGTARGTGTHDETITSNGAGYYVRPATVGEGGTGNFTGSIVSCYVVPTKESFTKSGFGTPKAAIFCLSNEYTDDDNQNHAVWAMGIAESATRRYCIMGTSEAGLSTSDSYRRISNTSCIAHLQYTDGTLRQAADFSAWVTDGVEIEWETLDMVLSTTAPIITIVLLTGSDLSVYVGDFTSPAVFEGITDVTAPGFQPDQVICLSCASTTAFDTTGNGLRLTVGFADNLGDVVTMSSLNMLSTDAVSTTAVRNMVSTLGVVSMPDASAAFDLQSFDSSGFSATALADGSVICAYLALKYTGGVKHWVGTVGSPITTGVYAVTTPGMKPQLVLHCPNFVDTTDLEVVTEAKGAGSWALAAFDATTDNTIGIFDEDNVTTTNTGSFAASKAAVVRRGLGTVASTSTFTSFDTNGWTLNCNGANATVRYWPSLAIGEFVSAFRPQVMLI